MMVINKEYLLDSDINNDEMLDSKNEYHNEKNYNGSDNSKIITISDHEDYNNDFKYDIKDVSSNIPDKESVIKTTFRDDEVQSEISETGKVVFSEQISDKEEGNEVVVDTTVVNPIGEDEEE